MLSGPTRPTETFVCPRLCPVASSGPGISGLESTKGRVSECRDALLNPGLW